MAHESRNPFAPHAPGIGIIDPYTPQRIIVGHGKLTTAYVRDARSNPSGKHGYPNASSSTVGRIHEKQPVFLADTKEHRYAQPDQKGETHMPIFGAFNGREIGKPFRVIGLSMDTMDLANRPIDVQGTLVIGGVDNMYNYGTHMFRYNDLIVFAPPKNYGSEHAPDYTPVWKQQVGHDSQTILPELLPLRPVDLATFFTGICDWMKNNPPPTANEPCNVDDITKIKEEVINYFDYPFSDDMINVFLWSALLARVASSPPATAAQAEKNYNAWITNQMERVGRENVSPFSGTSLGFLGEKTEDMKSHLVPMYVVKESGDVYRLVNLVQQYILAFLSNVTLGRARNNAGPKETIIVEVCKPWGW